MSFRTANPYHELILNGFGGLYTEADPRDLPKGPSPLCYDVDFLVGSVVIRPGLRSVISSFTPSPGSVSFQWLKSMKLIGGLSATLAQDSGGNLWSESLGTPGSMSSIYSAILNGARALSETINSREFIALSDLISGQDQPRQWDGVNLDRISQVGPGAGPSVPAATPVVYTVFNIQQPYAAVAIDSLAWGASINLYNAPPPATNLWFLSAVAATGFTTNLNVGDTVYISGANTISGQNPNGTYVVTSVGSYTDGDGTRQFFGVIADVALGSFARGTAGGQFQKTRALVRLSNPLPAEFSSVGTDIVIFGNSVTSWNAVWPIIDTPTEGELLISATALTANIATYTYAIASGNAPGWQASHVYSLGAQIVDSTGAGHVWEVTTQGTSGGTAPTFPASPTDGQTITDSTVVWTFKSGVSMPVIAFNTANGNGIFNVQNAPILSATSTQFTISLTGANVTSASENGRGVSGTGSLLVIDPGQKTVASGHPGVSPIYGTGTGGQVLPSMATQVSPGQRYAVCLFLTRNGYITPASPPVQFFTTGTSTSITFNNIPIGPPNVIGRIIAITGAGSETGGPYFWVPTPIVLPATEKTLGQTQMISATIIRDNTTTSLTVNLADAVLLASINISTKGNNLQQQRELGECVKVVQFAGRAVYIGERTKTDNLLNMTFDGGSVAGVPAGWSVSSGLAAYVSLTTSLVFGQSLYIKNTSGATLNPTGTTLLNMLTLSQGAYQDAILAPIVQPNTAYSIRMTAKIPSGNTGGSLVVELFSASLNQSWAFTTAFSGISATLKELTGAFLNPLWTPVPSDLKLRIYPLNIANGADVLIDRIEIYPASEPIYKTQASVSYISNPEAIDGVTGLIDTADFSSDPQTNGFRFLDKLHITTQSRTFQPIETDDEPSGWAIREVSNDVGSSGPLASDVGEEYVLIASRPGLYLFDGGSHIKVSQEIQHLWDSIYWPSQKTIWVKNDTHNQRILVGVPLPTPNQWLPKAATNATPLSPNVILMCSYLTQPTGRGIAEAIAVHASPFTGHLLWRDGLRKWTIWQIASPVSAWIDRSDGSEQLWLGGTTGLIFKLDPTAFTDNGAAIQETYTTFAFAEPFSEMQPFIGGVRKLYTYGTATIEGTGKWTLTMLPESLGTIYPATQPSFAAPSSAENDTEFPLNVPATRVFAQFTTDGVAGSYFKLKKLLLGVVREPRIPVRGI